MSIEELERRIAAVEEQVAELVAERAGSQTLRALRFDTEEHRRATESLVHEVAELRLDLSVRDAADSVTDQGVSRCLSKMETLLVAIAGHLGVGGEQT